MLYLLILVSLNQGYLYNLYITDYWYFQNTTLSYLCTTPSYLCTTLFLLRITLFWLCISLPLRLLHISPLCTYRRFRATFAIKSLMQFLTILQSLQLWPWIALPAKQLTRSHYLLHYPINLLPYFKKSLLLLHLQCFEFLYLSNERMTSLTDK